jgi:hypothetical protein
MPRGRMLRGRGLLRGIFDKETRRKRLVVMGAAMELRARLGLGERRDESGNGGRSGVRCEVDVRERGNSATCMAPVMRDRAVVLR